MRGASPFTRQQLRQHLVASGIAGEVATSRENNLTNYRRVAERRLGYTFGLDVDRAWSPAEVLAVMARRCGVSADEVHLDGVDRIDPERTLDGLDAMAARLAAAGRRRERVLVATGHPTGLLPLHLAVARALRTRARALLTPGLGAAYSTPGGEHREIRAVADVLMVSNRGDLNHTHSAEPMLLALRALSETGQALPDLVVADHGWAGAAGQAGIDTVAFADSNDPALFLGAEEGKVAVCVPLDDNVGPHLYEPVAAYLTAAIDAG